MSVIAVNCGILLVSCCNGNSVLGIDNLNSSGKCLLDTFVFISFFDFYYITQSIEGENKEKDEYFQICCTHPSLQILAGHEYYIIFYAFNQNLNALIINVLPVCQVEQIFIIQCLNRNSYSSFFSLVLLAWLMPVLLLLLFILKLVAPQQQQRRQLRVAQAYLG